MTSFFLKLLTKVINIACDILLEVDFFLSIMFIGLQTDMVTVALLSVRWV